METANLWKTIQNSVVEDIMCYSTTSLGFESQVLLFSPFQLLTNTVYSLKIFLWTEKVIYVLHLTFLNYNVGHHLHEKS